MPSIANEPLRVIYAERVESDTGVKYILTGQIWAYGICVTQKNNDLEVENSWEGVGASEDWPILARKRELRR